MIRIQEDRELDKRSGVALIIVLGMLSVLMLIAVAFSVTMRAERVAAGKYKSYLQSRSMAEVALVRAIEQIDNDVGDSICPNWLVVKSTGGSGAKCTDLYTGAATKFVPGFLMPDAKAAASQVEWVEVGGADGSYAYMILNSSGLLDIGSQNCASGADRWYGTNVNEIQIDSLPEISSVSSFNSDHATDIRYESVSDLWQSGNSGLSMFPSNLCTYSRFVRNNVGKVYIGGDNPDAWGTVQDDGNIAVSGAAVVAAFKALGLSDEQAQIAFLNLKDYVDIDDVPQDLARPCVERVPMIYEIRYKDELIIGHPIIKGTIPELIVDVWFPFSEGPNGSYFLEYDLDFENNGGNAAWVPNDVTGSKQISGLSAKSFASVTLASGLKPAGGDPTNISYKVEIKLKVTKAGAGTVDAAPWPESGDGCTFTVQRGNAASWPTGGKFYGSMQCDDPRRNWDFGDKRQWRKLKVDGVDRSRIGRINVVTELRWEMTGPSVGLDEDGCMRVANRELYSLFELGALTLGGAADAWKTIRIYHRAYGPGGYHDVLKDFTLSDAPTEARRGLVNINSESRDVLALAFLEMPRREYNSGDPIKLTTNAALNIASFVRSSGPYNSVSALGRIDWNKYIADIADGTQIDAESFLRNISGVVGVENNLFVVLCAGQSFFSKTSKYGAHAAGEQRAIAIVWRDPVNPAHPCFVRYFQWLPWD